MSLIKGPSQGFTLLELLVAVSIVGILTAISVPRYADYKKRAFDARAQSDLKNVALAEEVYFMDMERYLSCQNAGCQQLPGIVSLSQGVELNATGSETAFEATAKHAKGSGKAFRWSSESGGLQPQ